MYDNRDKTNTDTGKTPSDIDQDEGRLNNGELGGGISAEEGKTEGNKSGENNSRRRVTGNPDSASRRYK